MITALFSHEWTQIVYTVGCVLGTIAWIVAIGGNTSDWRSARRRYLNGSLSADLVQQKAKYVALSWPAILVVPVWPALLLVVPIGLVLGVVFGVRGTWRGANKLRNDLRGEIE